MFCFRITFDLYFSDSKEICEIISPNIKSFTFLYHNFITIYCLTQSVLRLVSLQDNYKHI